MNLFTVSILALIQGVAELLPVSSSAHVILVGKFLGFDPTTPEGVLLLLSLHSGTMMAVLIHYWKRWNANIQVVGWALFIKAIVVATALTGMVGLTLKAIIEKVFLQGNSNDRIEAIFGSSLLIASGLMATALLIAWAARHVRKHPSDQNLNVMAAVKIGAVQGICLPFRGFSRSGATISVGMLSKLNQGVAEAFSFALAVVLTPPLIFREWHHLNKNGVHTLVDRSTLFTHASVGFVISFGSGLVALKLLSQLVERGKWGYFAYYCATLSILVFLITFFWGR